MIFINCIYELNIKKFEMSRFFTDSFKLRLTSKRNWDRCAVFVIVYLIFGFELSIPSVGFQQQQQIKNQ